MVGALLIVDERSKVEVGKGGREYAKEFDASEPATDIEKGDRQKRNAGSQILNRG